MRVIFFVTGVAGAGRLAIQFARDMTLLTIYFQMLSIERVISDSMVKLVFVKRDQTGIKPLMFRVASSAGLLLHFSMKASVGRDI